MSGGPSADAGGPALRRAIPTDIPALRALIETSVRGLGARVYSAAQIEGALTHAFGVDPELIDDGTYHVVEAGGAIVACGGWSQRQKLHGGDTHRAGLAESIDPATMPARIRAFFVHPDWARRGLGRRLLERCMAEAAAAGFTRLELVATLAGVPLYAALGFAERETLQLPLPDGLSLPCVRMGREVAPSER